MAYNVQTLKAQQASDDERISFLRALTEQFAQGFFAEIDVFVEAATSAGLHGMSRRITTHTPNTMTAHHVRLFDMPFVIVLTPTAALTLSGGVLAYHLLVYHDDISTSSEMPLFDMTLTDGIMPRAAVRQMVSMATPLLTRFLFHTGLHEIGGHEMAAWLIQDMSQLHAVWPEALLKTPLLEMPCGAVSRSVGSDVNS